MAKQLQVEQSIIIDRPQSEVYEYLKYVKNQNQFSVWNMADPQQKTSESGIDGTVGFIYSWDSQLKNVGAGSQEIKNMKEGEFMAYELRFERPMKNIAQSAFVLHPVQENQTKVTWNFKGPTKFPMSLFKFLFQKMLGKDMAKSLDNLKAKLEL
ncbi:MAG: SRPBCC family protein [Lewinellaceae bacterium]|nr:SRPBCC family protein [Lewinellaceae bacterium]